MEKSVAFSEEADRVLKVLAFAGLVVFVIAEGWGLLSARRDYLDLDLVRPIMRLFLVDSIINGFALTMLGYGVRPENVLGYGVRPENVEVIHR